MNKFLKKRFTSSIITETQTGFFGTKYSMFMFISSYLVPVFVSILYCDLGGKKGYY